MKPPIDCTPPADLPDLLIVLDRKAKTKPFYLRIKIENGTDVIDLGDEQTLPGARQKARELGYEPAAWVDDSGIVMRF